MEKFVIHGGRPLRGEVSISGAKNAVVAILPATILADDVCRIENIPNISDVTYMVRILKQIGARVRVINKHTLEIDTTTVNSFTVPDELTKHMRASYYLIGALLGRDNQARVSMPGGCDLGIRPMDQHIKGFEFLGADVSIENAMVNAHAEKLIGSSVYMDVVSVGATVNIMLAAVKARGLTVIENAAKEPHIVDLANFLNSMGADVRGAGTDVIKIHGVEKLHGCTYSIIPDQIEAGTYMTAVAAAGGEVRINNIIPKHLDCITAKLVEMGVDVEEDGDSLIIRREGKLTSTNVKTMPYPGFPTDMQPQIAAVLCLAKGTSILNEGVWDNRYRYADEFRRMGANIQVNGKVAVIEGVESLTGAPVCACDLRAGAAMIVAGLAAHGVTEGDQVYHIERGYENIVEKLSKLGADIREVAIPEEEWRNGVG